MDTKNLSGIFIVYPQSRLIYDGKKDMIVKTKQIVRHLDTPILLVDRRLCYGVIKLSLEKEGGVEDFQELFQRHRITENRRKRWWPEVEKFYFYNIKVVEKFSRPRAWERPEKIQAYAKIVNFIKNIKFEEITLENLKDFSTKSLIILNLKLIKSYENNFAKEK